MSSPNSAFPSPSLQATLRLVSLVFSKRTWTPSGWVRTNGFGIAVWLPSQAILSSASGTAAGAVVATGGGAADADCRGVSGGPPEPTTAAGLQPVEVTARAVTRSVNAPARSRSTAIPVLVRGSDVRGTPGGAACYFLRTSSIALPCEVTPGPRARPRRQPAHHVRIEGRIG